MKDNLLEGHSGCKLLLLKSENSDHIEGVRKLSKGREYNERLKAQSLKQATFNSKEFLSPEVYNEGTIKDIYYFDMKYIRGTTFSSSIKNLDSNEIELIANKIIALIKENRDSSETLNQSDSELLVIKKLSNIEKSLNSTKKNTLGETFNYLENYQWDNLKNSPCHGDLTFENILISDQGIYLIDFLDTFIETWISDVSKMLQDLIVGWSFRKEIIAKKISEHEKIKMNLFKDIFCKNINNTINEQKFWEQVHAYLILDLLRIIPYTDNEEIYQFIEKAILKLTTEVEKGKFYEYINNNKTF